MIKLGTYTARAVAGSEQYGVSSNGGDQIALTLEIVGGEHEGERVTTVLPFAGKAPKYSAERLRACGWTGSNPADLRGVDANKVTIRVFEEEFKGETRTKVEIQTGGGAFTFKDTMSDSARRAFGAKYAVPAEGVATPAKKVDFG